MTNTEFEMNKWKQTEVQNYVVDYYVIKSPPKLIELRLRLTCKNQFTTKIDPNVAMSECKRIKDYMVKEGYLDDSISDTYQFDDLAINVLFIYKRNVNTEATIFDKFCVWLRKKIYE
jgi:hypothetical protein